MMHKSPPILAGVRTSTAPALIHLLVARPRIIELFPSAKAFVFLVRLREICETNGLFIELRR